MQHRKPSNGEALRPAVPLFRRSMQFCRYILELPFVDFLESGSMLHHLVASQAITFRISMPKIKEWRLESFDYGSLPAQKIDFAIDDHRFVMFFSCVSDTYADSGECLAQKQEAFGMGEFPNGTYEIKFDRVENFETGEFFERQEAGFSPMTYGRMRRLSAAIVQIVRYHMDTVGAKLYLAVAESDKLKSFYDRLAIKPAHVLGCTVSKDLGDERLGYAIKTPSFDR
jgi:hypothetical protein